MTYSEQSAQLAVDSSVAVLVLSNPECNDVEFLMLKPKRMGTCELAELKARWPGRELRSVGTIGLVGTSPRWALKEPLTFEQISALADAFLAYLHVLFCDALAGRQESAEVAELERLHTIADTRTEA
jgi:hypothetical protein